MFLPGNPTSLMYAFTDEIVPMASVGSKRSAYCQGVSSEWLLADRSARYFKRIHFCAGGVASGNMISLTQALSRAPRREELGLPGPQGPSRDSLKVATGAAAILASERLRLCFHATNILSTAL